MSKKSRSSSATAAADGGTTTPPATPTVTYYQQVVAQFMQKIDEAAALVPYLEAPHPDTIDFVRGHLSVPLPGLAIVVSHVEQQPEIGAVGKLDPVKGRDTLQYTDAIDPAIEKVGILYQKMKFGRNSKVAELTADSQQTYVISQGLARDPESSHLRPVVASMKDALGVARPRRKKKEAPPSLPHAA
jgi:hypothetical protein